MPYHEFMRDEMQKSLCQKLNFPSGEGLHMAHTIMEISTGLVGGTTGRVKGQDKGWQKHLLRARDNGEEPAKAIMFTRLEYQDGTHKEGTH
eukprot:17604-Karenia_brevis.AAC.1